MNVFAELLHMTALAFLYIAVLLVGWELSVKPWEEKKEPWAGGKPLSWKEEKS